MINDDIKINQYDEHTEFVYAFVREDMPSIVQAIQFGHATYACGRNVGYGERIDEEWADEAEESSYSPNFCVFGVKDAKELNEVAEYLRSRNFRFSMFDEPDFDLGYTAIAVQPIRGEDRKAFSIFNLLRM